MQNKLIAILTITVVCLLIALSESCTKQDQKDRRINNLLNERKLDTLRDKSGNQTATIEAYEATISDLRSKVQSKDETIRRLQQTAKKEGNNLVSSVAVDLEIRSKGKDTTSVTPKDTIIKDGVKFIFPEYRATIVKHWVSYDLRMNKDSSYVSSITRLNMDVNSILRRDTTMKWRGRFAAKKIYTQVKQYNPDSGVKEMHSYVQIGKKKHTGLKIVIGMLIFEGIHKLLTGEI